MIDLTKNVGFPFQFDVETWDFSYQSDFFKLVHSRVYTIKDSSLKKYYLNPVTVLISKIFGSYWFVGHAGIWGDMPVRLKFMVLNRDYVGVETIKTKTVFVEDKPRLIDVVYGQVKVIMFPPDLKIRALGNQENTDVIVCDLQTMDKLLIPAGYVYTIINSDPKDVAVVLEIHHKDHKNHVLYTQGRGAPFYYVLRNTSHEIVKNPQYRFINKYATLGQGRNKILKKYNVSPKTPILKQLSRKSTKFVDMLDSMQSETLAELIYNNLDDIVQFSHPNF